MRTNVNIADDAREFALIYADTNGLSLGEAITELILKSKPGSSPEDSITRFGRSASGFPTLAKKGRRLTTEMILKAQEEELV